jgi:hypothetical protein
MRTTTSRTGALFLAAGALTALALTLPLWEFRMSAPQYPDEALHVRVLRTGLAGDLQEVETLQKFVGVSFPTSLPELELVTPVLLVMAAVFVLAGLVGVGRVGRAVRIAATVALLGVLAFALIAVQARLYTVGHDRDPEAPMARMKDFTPPAIGPASVGNFTVWSYPHLGGLALALAAGLAVAGTRRSFPPRSGAPVGSRVLEVLL